MLKFYTSFLLLVSLLSYAQTDLLIQIPLEEQVNNAQLIAEGEIIAKKSYWDVGRKNIYTVNTLEVSKLYKGADATRISIVTTGGAVGLKAQIDYPSLELNKEEKGTFILEKFNLELEGYHDNLPLNQVTGLSQGLFRYNTRARKIYNPITQLASPEELEQKITALTNKKPKQIKAVDYFEVKKKKVPLLQTANVVAANISSINPTTTVAGNKSVLTINGSGFGSTRGTVRFPNADTGGTTNIDALGTQIVSWTDSQIEVEVPYKAGTGTVEVETAANSIAQRSGLTVSHAYTGKNRADFIANGNKETEYRIHHVGSDHNATATESNFDANGAYLFKFHTDVANNTAAKAAFKSAFDLLVCNSGINLKLSSDTTTAKDADDNINSICFGTLSNNLGAVVRTRLGYEYVSTNGVYSGFYVYVYEMDYVFNENLSWSFDSSTTSNTEYDFNAIARHETAHAGGLGHVIDNQKIMHYETFKGPNNITSTTTYTPIINKITYDRTITPKANLLKTDFSDCYKQSLENEEHRLVPFRVYPNPASNTLHISGQKAIEKARVYNITGALVYEATTDDGLGTSLVSINVGGFMTGVYFVQINAGDASQSYRFVRE